MIGETYLERGKPVKVLVAWQGPKKSEREAVAIEFGKRRRRGAPIVQWQTGFTPRGGPRNVLIQREDGTLVVRPFRGLRKPK